MPGAWERGRLARMPGAWVRGRLARMPGAWVRGRLARMPGAWERGRPRPHALRLGARASRPKPGSAGVPARVRRLRADGD
jgi:hypothetical protein